jgi:hypothetical protein
MALSLTEEAMLLCTRIVLHFAARGCGVIYRCSFAKIRTALCEDEITANGDDGDDNCLTQSNDLMPRNASLVEKSHWIVPVFCKEA